MYLEVEYIQARYIGYKVSPKLRNDCIIMSNNVYYNTL